MSQCCLNNLVGHEKSRRPLSYEAKEAGKKVSLLLEQVHGDDLCCHLDPDRNLQTQLA